jgi:hypothetical protein
MSMSEPGEFLQPTTPVRLEFTLTADFGRRSKMLQSE